MAEPRGPDARLLHTVRIRLVLWSAGATLAVLVVLGLVVFAAVARSLASSSTDQLAARATTIGRFVAGVPVIVGGGPGLGDGGPPIGLVVGGPSSGTFAWVITEDGRVFGPQEVALHDLPDQSSASTARSTGRQDVRQTSVNGAPFRILSQPVDRNGRTAVVQVAQETTAEQQTLTILATVLVVGGLLAVAAAAAVGWLYADRALVPIRDSLRRQREFAADASHELRTPLTVIRAGVEHLLRHPELRVADATDELEDVRAEVDHLTALVGDLLVLARTDSGMIEIEPLPVDLASVAEEALAPIAPIAAGRDVALVLDPEPAPIVGDAGRLRQLVRILADNAVAHARTAVTIRIRPATGDHGHGRPGSPGAALEVEDDGPGIRPEDLDRVFERFWRSDDAPSGGTGLGLAIAAWIVERHGGTIDAANRPEGGARFTVALPAAPPGAPTSA